MTSGFSSLVKKRFFFLMLTHDAISSVCLSISSKVGEIFTANVCSLSHMLSLLSSSEAKESKSVDTQSRFESL